MTGSLPLFRIRFSTWLVRLMFVPCSARLHGMTMYHLTTVVPLTKAAILDAKNNCTQYHYAYKDTTTKDPIKCNEIQKM